MTTPAAVRLKGLQQHGLLLPPANARKPEIRYRKGRFDQMRILDGEADGLAVHQTSAIDVSRRDPAGERSVQCRVLERELGFFDCSGRFGDAVLRRFHAVFRRFHALFGGGYSCGVGFIASLRLIVLLFDQARRLEQISRAYIFNLGRVEVCARSCKLRLRLRPLRLRLRKLRLRLGMLCLGLLERMLVVERTHLGQFGISGHFVARLNIAHTTIGAAHLENSLNDSTGFECQVDLLEGFDAHGIPLLGAGPYLFRHACPHNLDHGFDMLLLTATRQEQCRAYQEDF